MKRYAKKLGRETKNVNELPFTPPDREIIINVLAETTVNGRIESIAYWSISSVPVEPPSMLPIFLGVVSAVLLFALLFVVLVVIIMRRRKIQIPETQRLISESRDLSSPVQ
jgi:hypothetical protein